MNHFTFQKYVNFEPYEKKEVIVLFRESIQSEIFK